MPTSNLNWRGIITIGIIAGLVQVASGIAMYVLGVYFATWSMFVTWLVLILCVVLGIKRYRERYLDNSITYGGSLLIGICIGVCIGVVYAVYNVVSVSFFYPNFINEMVDAQVANRSEGLNQEQMAELAKSLREGTTAFTIAFWNLVRLPVFSTVISLVASLFLTKQKSEPAGKE
ncbi:MAG: DUF4199 domain-containing protein [Bacteroidota bacterium]